MINAIIAAISIALNAEFGDGYENITEENEQDLHEPCFFISCLSPGMRQYLGTRYERRNMFCIQLIPEAGNENEKCRAAVERMFECLEYISVNGDMIRGTDMKCEISGGILNFFVNYNFFVYRVKDEEKMETLSSNTKVEG